MLLKEVFNRGPKLEVIAFCSSRMGNYAKKLKTVDFVPELPHTATGKIDKLALKAKYCGGT